MLEINSTSELNQKLEQIRSCTQLNYGSTVTCYTIQVSVCVTPLLVSMFTLLSNASVPSILNISWPSCFPVKCGTGKMPFVNITVWHSGWTNGPVCRFKIAKPQCCLFSFNKNCFFVQFLQCLFFQPFLFLIILGREIVLSVNCLFTLH